MQQIRTKLTRLKTKLSESITTETDVFGYAGVNKQDILAYIDQTYGLVAKLENLRGTFALIALERKIAPELERCSEVLEDIVKNGGGGTKFNGFLNSLTRIHDEIYLTHVVYCSEGLNVEASVGRAQEKLDELSNTVELLQPDITEMKGLTNQLQEYINAADEAIESMNATLAKATEQSQQISQAKEQASASSSAIAKFETDAKEQRGTISNLASQASTAEKKLQKLISDVTNQSKVIQETLTDAGKTKEQNDTHQKAITDTLRLASKYGMAASFKERKEELVWPLRVWGTVFTGSIVGLCYFALEYIVPNIQSGNLPTLGEVFVKLTLVSPLVWLGWMAAKQYGYTARIREDYSFKYASALAFEGYKKEAAEIDQTIQKELLRVATHNMTLNPLRIYSDESNHASPLHDLMEKFFARRTAPIEAKPSGED